MPRSSRRREGESSAAYLERLMTEAGIGEVTVPGRTGWQEPLVVRGMRQGSTSGYVTQETTDTSWVRITRDSSSRQVERGRVAVSATGEVELVSENYQEDGEMGKGRMLGWARNVRKMVKECEGRLIADTDGGSSVAREVATLNNSIGVMLDMMVNDRGVKVRKNRTVSETVRQLSEVTGVGVVSCGCCAKVVLEVSSFRVGGNADRVCGDCLKRAYYWDGGRWMAWADAGTELVAHRRGIVDEQMGSYSEDVMAVSGKKFWGEGKEGKVWMGVELEVERGHLGGTIAVVKEIKKALGGDFVLVKRDGSLGDGAEIVSKPATLEVHTGGKWSGFFKGVGKELRSAATDTCGMHVHVGKEFLRPSQLVKMLKFLNAEENREFLEKVAGRKLERWSAQTKIEKVGTWVTLGTDGRSSVRKYQILNLMKDHTVEFRMFKGTLIEEMFYRNLEFVDAVCMWARETAGGKTRVVDFVEWVEKNRGSYKRLVVALVEWGYSGVKLGKVQRQMYRLPQRDELRRA